MLKKYLLKIKTHSTSNGDISRIFFNLVIGVYDVEDLQNNKKELMNHKTNQKNRGFTFFGRQAEGNSLYNNDFSPDDFKSSLGLYNPQFRKFEANYSKNLILYLLITKYV